MSSESSTDSEFDVIESKSMVKRNFFLNVNLVCYINYIIIMKLFVLF